MVFLSGGNFDGQTKDVTPNNSETIRIYYADPSGSQLIDIYMRLNGETRIIDGELLEVYLYYKTIEN